jgi:hypothetical protein
MDQGGTIPPPWMDKRMQGLGPRENRTEGAKSVQTSPTNTMMLAAPMYWTRGESTELLTRRRIVRLLSSRVQQLFWMRRLSHEGIRKRSRQFGSRPQSTFAAGMKWIASSCTETMNDRILCDIHHKCKSLVVLMAPESARKGYNAHIHKRKHRAYNIRDHYRMNIMSSLDPCTQTMC